MSELRTTRWRATIIVEFETFDYPSGEQITAERNAAWIADGAGRAEGDINASRADITVASIERLPDPASAPAPHQQHATREQDAVTRRREAR